MYQNIYKIQYVVASMHTYVFNQMEDGVREEEKKKKKYEKK